ncbi:hypothetical protein WME79_33775 [Sorangium sp. So ce726]
MIPGRVSICVATCYRAPSLMPMVRLSIRLFDGGALDPPENTIVEADQTR